MSSETVIGLMSGTSIDGLDACAVNFGGKTPKVLGTQSISWPTETAAALHALCSDGPSELEAWGGLKNVIAQRSAVLVKELLAKLSLRPEDILAIGSHGQTVRHRPHKGFSLQLDNGPLLAELTHIDAVCDFRSADLACGGEGAPLTPAFHRRVLSSETSCRYVLNLGGIANLTAMRPGGEVAAGFDCGPANTLLDLACRELLSEPFDRDSKTALKGTLNKKMLDALLAHPYLKRPLPKSTGREDFNSGTIKEYLEECKKEPGKIPDVLYTLTEFTARAAADAIKMLQDTLNLGEGELILCGGGAFNPLLRERLSALTAPLGLTAHKSSEFGVSEQYLESEAFAYFAWCLVKGIPLSLKEATGASHDTLCGVLCPAPDGAFRRGLKQA